ncbi:MAG: hypothetical protein COW02_07375 [Comamonadaceae bacterium CG12_big_fil_rev_8_21_14_0_65_59_15]|nr:MAG: hypothetical protein COW02_07375 [Comamonadaceae bacterium CG12_big_fil_rev_8_21_14_0_65_59_15]
MIGVTTVWHYLLDAPPLLPALAVMHWGWRLAWALVLGAGAVWFAQVLGFKRWGRGRWAALVLVVAVAAVMLSALWPGPASPAYWLALAFQSPSLVTALLCARFLWSAAATGLAAPMLEFVPAPVASTPTPMARWPDGAVRAGAGLGLVACGTLLGWLLLGDTLAWWLPSVYAWGFAPLALLTVLGMLFSLMWLGQRSAALQRFGVLLALVLVLFVFTRLPSGNLWDALLDPWLWLLLQLALLRDLWRRAQLTGL